jgi:hypothetical protein
MELDNPFGNEAPWGTIVVSASDYDALLAEKEALKGELFEARQAAFKEGIARGELERQLAEAQQRCELLEKEVAECRQKLGVQS